MQRMLCPLILSTCALPCRAEARGGPGSGPKLIRIVVPFSPGASMTR